MGEKEFTKELSPAGEIKKVIPIENLKDALIYAEQDLKDGWGKAV